MQRVLALTSSCCCLLVHHDCALSIFAGDDFATQSLALTNANNYDIRINGATRIVQDYTTVSNNRSQGKADSSRLRS